MFVCLSVGVKKNQTATLLCHYRGNLVKNFLDNSLTFVCHVLSLGKLYLP